MRPLTIVLEDAAATERFGRVLAAALLSANPGALLLYGPLGAGKTTLCRHLVRSLPGGETAEVASPSFTICNIYSTQPPVHHFDLYRLDAGCEDESLEESFDDTEILTIVEWPERLHPDTLPADGLRLCLGPGPGGPDSRQVECAAFGPCAKECLATLHSHYPQ